jgi:hypothetical protein
VNSLARNRESTTTKGLLILEAQPLTRFFRHIEVS